MKRENGVGTFYTISFLISIVSNKGTLMNGGEYLNQNLRRRNKTEACQFLDFLNSPTQKSVLL